MTSSVTWSKSYDFGGHNAFNPFAEHLDRAPLDLDRALVFSVGHVWDLPFGPGRRLLNSGGPVRHVVGGWQFSGIGRWMSGTPFTPVVANTASLNSDCCQLRPNRLGEGTLANPSRNAWFDRSAFQVPGAFIFGNSGRNILRGPTFFASDWALSKTFRFKEAKKLEIRWEGYNVFNTTNLANPVASIDSATAGSILNISHPMRRQQFGLHFSF